MSARHRTSSPATADGGAAVLAARGVVMLSSHPSQMCGVSDYTGQLLRRLSPEMPARNIQLDVRLGILPYVRSCMRAASATARTRPACVHLQYTPTTSGPFAPLLLFLARLRGGEIVISAHERPSTYERKLVRPLRWLFRMFERALYAQASTVIVFSRVHADELRTRFGVAADVMPLGIEAAQTHVAANAMGRPPVITFAGFVRRAKGLEDLIAAAPLIASALGRCNVRIVGASTQRDAVYAASLRKRAAAVSDPERCAVEFIGEVASDEYRRMMAEADLFVFPFRTVSQSITLSEVVALGTPVVTSDLGGAGETVRDHGIGLTYPAGDVESLAAAVVRMLGDRALYESCRENVRAYAQLAGWPALGARHVAVYRELAA